MLKISSLKIPINDTDIEKYIVKKIKVSLKSLKSFTVLKKSIDSRNKDSIKYVMTVAAKVDCEEKILAKFRNDNTVSMYAPYSYSMPERKSFAKRPLVVGFGPAGMFAAYILAKCGANPIVIERGKEADKRAEDVKIFSENAVLDTESNIQFGEGGAGTFSDGKLNTGINDSRIKYVLETFVKHGANENILYEGKPHIGTDILRKVVVNMRKEIISLGGEIHFSSKLVDIKSENGKVVSVEYENNGNKYTLETDNIILATGHSARDTFYMLNQKGIKLIQKSFSVGVRIEHLQKDINYAMYGDSSVLLPPAYYKSAVHLKNGRGVYTFCMCPGGMVVPAASEQGGIVTNGMSNSKRDEINSNAAVLVGIEPGDIDSENLFSGIELQRKIEKTAYLSTGCSYKAPSLRFGDFLRNENSKQFGKILPSYSIGTEFVPLQEYLPEFVTESLKEGITLIGNKIKGFSDDDAVLTGPETRSTSPLRIERDEKGNSVSLSGLFPCGEGAGYAGGIMSAAVDGIKTAEKLLRQ